MEIQSETLWRKSKLKRTEIVIAQKSNAIGSDQKCFNMTRSKYITGNKTYKIKGIEENISIEWVR